MIRRMGESGFRPLWENVQRESRLPRSRISQRSSARANGAYYRETYKMLRELGLQRVRSRHPIGESPPARRLFGPLEKLSYTAGGFIDRHATSAATTRAKRPNGPLRDGQTSQIAAPCDSRRKSPPGKPRQLSSPVMDPHYNGKPSMISETTFCRPNRLSLRGPAILRSLRFIASQRPIDTLCFRR